MPQDSDRAAATSSSPPPARSEGGRETSRTVVSRDGTRIWLRERSGPPAEGHEARPRAILSDGIACSGFIWKYLWDSLAQQLAVAHYHYRGHGRSAAPPNPRSITLSDVVDDLDAVRASFADERVVLVGHSMGCQVALEGYRRDPERVAALVLVCGASGRITYTFRNTTILAQALPRVLEQVEAHPHIARALWSRVDPDLALKLAFRLGEVDARAFAEDLRPYLEHMSDLDLGLYLRLLQSAGEHSAADLLPSIQCPVLVVAAERDAFTPPHLAEEMAAAIPGAELCMVKGGTHALPIEQRELVVERVATFLRDRVGAPLPG